MYRLQLTSMPEFPRNRGETHIYSRVRYSSKLTFSEIRYKYYCIPTKRHNIQALVSVIMQAPRSATESLAQNTCKHHSHRDFLVTQISRNIKYSRLAVVVSTD